MTSEVNTVLLQMLLNIPVTPKFTNKLLQKNKGIVQFPRLQKIWKNIYLYFTRDYSQPPNYRKYLMVDLINYENNYYYIQITEYIQHRWFGIHNL